MLFGDRSIEPRRARSASGVAQSFPFHSPTSGSVTSLCLYVDRDSHAKSLVAGIYTSSRRHPGRLLGAGSLSSPRAGRWNLVDIAATPVSAGARYWVAVLGKRGSIAVRQRHSATCHGVKARRGAVGSLPSSWPNSSHWAGCPMSAYAVGVRRRPVTTHRPGGTSSSPPSGPSQHCSTTFAPSSWSASAITEAGTGGQTLCLSAGTYPDLELIGYHPSSTVTIEPVSGATVGLGRVTLTGVSNVTITGFGPSNGSSSSDGLTTQGEYSGPNYNIEFSYNAMSRAGVYITQNPMRNANIVITHNRFVGFASSGETDRVNLDTRSALNCPNGVTVSYNLMQGGESDGIDIDGDNCGSQILHNEITGIVESNCNGIHCDAIQDNGGGIQTVISGNYFHNNSDGLLFDDGNTGPDKITGNVFDNPGGRCVEGMYGDGTLFNHNTFDCNVAIGQDHNSEPTTNVTFTNNVFGPSANSGFTYAPSYSQFGSFRMLDYNLRMSGDYDGGPAGAHDVIGSPTYAGGKEPASYSGWALAPSSRGVGKGSDGTNMGATITSVGP